MRLFVLLGSLAVLSACAVQPPEPVVSSFNGDSVEIQIQNIGFVAAEALVQSRTAADSKAVDICRRGPNKRAEYVSTRTITTANAYVTHEARLYLCLR